MYLTTHFMGCAHRRVNGQLALMMDSKRPLVIIENEFWVEYIMLLTF